MAVKQFFESIKDHSIGKHLVLDRYLKAWFPILARSSSRLLFIDGFAGSGQYENGHFGSPIIAIDAVLEHHDKLLKGKEVVFFFIEPDKKRLDHLKQLINSRYQNLPDKITVKYSDKHFDNTITELLDYIDEQNKRLEPCFAMIDPFGVSGAPMDVVRRLLENPKAEIYFSFMYQFINRFKSTPAFESKLTSLYGTDEWKAALDINCTQERKGFLINLYKMQLKKTPGTQVVHFDLFTGNSHVYSIFFASKSWLGSDRMKEAIWKIAPDGDFIYRGSATSTLDLAAPEFLSLINAITDKFQGQWIDIKRVQEFVGSDQTDYHGAQIRKNALKEIEKQGLLEIHPEHSRKKNYTYPDGIKFRISAPLL